jgi:DNA invertase Pin-like site-specific DNA recombinase
MSNTSDTATMRATEAEAQSETTAQAAQEDAAARAISPPEGAAAGAQPEPKPDVSDKGAQELLPQLFSYFHNNKEELARALGVHRSTVDRWISGKSRPNNSTLLRMRRIAQERRIE